MTIYFISSCQKELLKKANAGQDFETLASGIDSLWEEKQKLLMEYADLAGLRQRMEVLEAFMAKQHGADGLR